MLLSLILNWSMGILSYITKSKYSSPALYGISPVSQSLLKLSVQIALKLPERGSEDFCVDTAVTVDVSPSGRTTIMSNVGLLCSFSTVMVMTTLAAATLESVIKLPLLSYRCSSYLISVDQTVLQY